VAERYRRDTGDNTPVLIASTASPYKFSDAVLQALGETVEGDGEGLLERLEKRTQWPVPENLRGLSEKPVQFTQTVCPADMERAVLEIMER